MERRARPPRLLRAMFRLLTSDSAASALLLGLLALGAVGLGWLAGTQRTENATAFQGDRGASPPALAALAGAEEVAPTRRPLVPNRAGWVERETEREPGSAVRLSAARSERDFLEAFLALEREAHGTLAAQAEERLEGTSSGAEKVGFLRALARLDPAGSVRWLEHAVRTLPATLDSDGASVAAYALGVLACRAPREEAPRRALERLALWEVGLEPALRRSAAAEYARSAPDVELELLRPALAGANDELFVAGVQAVLETRTDAGAAARLLAQFGAERAQRPPAEE